MTLPSRRSTLALAAAAAALASLAALSCGPSRHVPGPTDHQRRSDEIIALDRDIVRWRQELGLAPQPESRWFLVNPKIERDVPWTPAAGPRSAECRDVCDLARYICDAKDQICRIAGDMGDDVWARHKCEKAKASCREAKKSCRDCR